MPTEAQGTIKIANVNGELVPFMPKTDIRSIKDRETGLTAFQAVSEINAEIERRNADSPIKVMYEMPTEENTESVRNKSLIGAVVPMSSERKIFLNAKISKPANGVFFCYGETFTITYELFNASNVQITGAKIKPGDRTSVKDITLDVAETKHVVYEGTIKEEDVVWCVQNNERKSIASVMSFSGSDSFTFYGKSTVQLNCIPSDSGFYNPTMTLGISSSSEGSNIGHKTTKTFTLKNTSKGPFSGPLQIETTDNYGKVHLSTEKTIAPGEEKSVKVEVTITEDDILNHQDWQFHLQVSGTSFLGKEYSLSTDWTLDPSDPNPKLEVVYAITNSPSVGALWTDGENISYKITATNKGNLTLTNVSILDQNTNISSSFDSLAPGGSAVIENEAFAMQIPAGNQSGTVECTAAASASAPNELTVAISIIKLSALTDKCSGFQYTVDTAQYSETNATTGAIFYPNINSVTVVADWGDGTMSRLSASSASRTHTYSAPGTYTVTVSSSDWSQTYLRSTSEAISMENDPDLVWFRRTLIALNGALPRFANPSMSYAFAYCPKLTSISTGFFSSYGSNSVFSSCFSGCTSLQTLPEDLFSYCTSATTFASCFYGCTGLTSVPSTIFRNCSAVTTVDSIFYNCSSLTALPEGLFADCPGIAAFDYICRGCTNLQTIPEDLFKYSPNAASIGGAFWACKNLQTIPEDLLRYNVAATNVGAFFCSAAGSAFSNFPVNFLKYNVNVTTLTANNYGFFEGNSINYFSLRIGSPNVSNVSYFSSNYGTVYVPSGSTTASSFSTYNNKNGYKLTIVQE